MLNWVSEMRIAARLHVSLLARLGLFVGAAVAAPAGVACTTTPVATVLQPEDLVPKEGFEFSADAVLNENSDFENIFYAEKQIQRFFEKTPYAGRPSFLATYSSNGIAASSAVLQAAAAYRLSPMVFMVELQVTQGLVGERYYPSDSRRVEYAFGCGCNGRGTCDPAFAGLDKQLVCLGAEYRRALDAAQGGRPTPGGWTLGAPGTTLDGKKVQPANAPTAALYDRRPKVAEKEAGGVWVFWNLWNTYSESSSLF